MKCKQGDMAIVISARNEENIGKVVTCVKFHGNLSGTEHHINGRVIRFSPLFDYDNMWEVDRDLIWSSEAKPEKKLLFPFVRDRHLMPIRPDEMDKEVMNRCNVPVEEAL